MSHPMLSQCHRRPIYLRIDLTYLVITPTVGYIFVDNYSELELIFTTGIIGMWAWEIKHRLCKSILCAFTGEPWQILPQKVWFYLLYCSCHCMEKTGTGFSQLFPGITPHLLTLASNFRIPIYRDVLLSLGICSVSKRSCAAILQQGGGQAITIVVGGAAEVGFHYCWITGHWKCHRAYVLVQGKMNWR